jgi:hypothetical protein
VPALATTFGVASLMMADITAAGCAAGTEERYRAAAPATCGAAMDVPLMVAVAVAEEIPAETMEEPGANRSRQSPKFE